MNNMADRAELRMMMLITGHKDEKKATALLNRFRVPVQYLCRGEGTASSELMDYLGLGSTGKAVLLCVVLKNQVPVLFHAINQELNLKKRGKGIAFTFPVSGVNMFILKLLNEEVQQKIMEHLERSENHMTSEITHSFLMVTINQGYSEEVMAAAREAGATGGTVLQARRLGSEETIKRWGISVQPEKEIIFILTEQEKKHDIMKSIGEKCGIHSNAQGIVISIPVDAVTGLEMTRSLTKVPKDAT